MGPRSHSARVRAHQNWQAMHHAILGGLTIFLSSMCLKIDASLLEQGALPVDLELSPFK